MNAKLLFVVFCVLPFVTLALISPNDMKEYQSIVDKIIATAKGPQKGASWNKLADLTDFFGPRLLGSESLTQAIHWLFEQMKNDGFENVHVERVDNCTHWIRGEESLELVSPRAQKLPITALGNSVSTPAGGITAEIVMVTSWDDLEAKKDRINGSIVVYNVPFQGYGRTVEYRWSGASRAAKYGAVASLVRSIAPFSIGSPHTGVMEYDPAFPKIPTAAITLEDADMLDRMVKRGQKVILKLVLGSHSLPTISSYNVVGEIVGSTYPNEVIIMGGHIDSWDIGPQVGAMDDGCGVMICYEALRLLIKNGLKPKRTIRVIAWVGEEFGAFGGNAYADAHKDELKDVLLAFESDGGAFTPYGFGLGGASDAAYEYIQQIASLQTSINATLVTKVGGGADIDKMMQSGVPGMMPLVRNEKYFWFHHSIGDSMSVLSPDDMDLCSASIASMMYVVADMKDRLPR